MTQVFANASMSMAPLELDDPTGNAGNFVIETSRLESRAGEAVKALEGGWEGAGSSACPGFLIGVCSSLGGDASRVHIVVLIPGCRRVVSTCVHCQELQLNGT